MKSIMILFLICVFLFMIPCRAQNNTTQPIYCSSACVDYADACWGPSQNECYACSTSLYRLSSDNGTCIQAQQHQEMFYELKTNNIDLSGYSTSNPSPINCGGYGLSGQYTAGSYISKTFNNLGLNHYDLVVRFGVGFIGSWNSFDQIQIEVDGALYTKNYSCQVPSDVCSGSDIDCFKIIEIIIPHEAQSTSIKITSNIAETNPLVQYWGVKDLIIGMKTCHPRCSTCTGPTSAECLSCAQGYFLLGNTCVVDCNEQYKIPDLRKCSPSCPSRYYPTSISTCDLCTKGCLACNDKESCNLWDDESQNMNLWEKHLLFWILLIILSLLVVFYLFWKCLIKKYIDKITELSDSQVSPSEDNSLKKNMIANDSENNSTLQNKESTNGDQARGKFNSGDCFKNEPKVHEYSSAVWLEEPENEESIPPLLKRRKKRQRDQEFKVEVRDYDSKADDSHRSKGEHFKVQELPYLNENFQL